MQKSIRRADGLTAQRALRTLYQHDPTLDVAAIARSSPARTSELAALGAVVHDGDALRKRESSAAK